MTGTTVRYYEDYEVGEEFNTPGRPITEAHVGIHGGNAGDLHELQMNAAYAKKTLFGQRPVDAPLVYLIMAGLLSSHPELRSSDTNICSYGIDKMRLPKPVFIGDTLAVHRTVVSKRRKGEAAGIVTFRDEVYNQNQELVMVCETLEYIKARP